MEVDEAALGDSVVNLSQEPNYGAFLDVPGPSDENPRVARVEASAGEQVLPMPEVGAPKPFSPLSGKGRGTSGAVPGLSGRSELSAVSGAVSGLSDSTRPDFLEASRAAPGLGGIARDGPPVVDDDRDDDQAELIPAAEDGRLQKMEVLLAQVLEENQLLKNKLSTESQSSWYSQRTVQGDGLGQCSPASFAHGYDRFQVASSAGVSPVGPCGSRDFTGDYLDSMGSMVGPSFGFPGQQLSVNRARLQQAQFAGALNFPGVGEVSGALGGSRGLPVQGSGVLRPLPPPVEPPTSSCTSVASSVCSRCPGRRSDSRDGLRVLYT